jgi:hypothetical protein
VGDIFGSVSILLCEPIMSMVNRTISAITGIPNSWVTRVIGLNGTTRELLDRIRSSSLGAGFLGGDASGVHPAALWSIAPNGSVFMRTYASAGKPMESRFSLFEAGQPQPLRAIASAEYYASCYRILEGWGDDGPLGALRSAVVRNCEDDAMWRIGWSARMRRVRPVLQELNTAQVAEGALTNLIGNHLPGFIANATPVAGAIDWVFSNDGSPVTQALETLFGPIVNPDPNDRSAIIH